jgi:hypothetical protein
MYRLLDIFFFVFHSALILFILLGWLWRPARKAHLVVVGLTALSWFGLGIWYGFGYCPCTDWHWQVRYQLGHVDMPNSYIKFLVDACTGWDTNARLVDTTTVAAFGAACVASVYVNVALRTKASPEEPQEKHE